MVAVGSGIVAATTTMLARALHLVGVDTSDVKVVGFDVGAAVRSELDRTKCFAPKG